MIDEMLPSSSRVQALNAKEDWCIAPVDVQHLDRAL